MPSKLEWIILDSISNNHDRLDPIKFIFVRETPTKSYPNFNIFYY